MLDATEDGNDERPASSRREGFPEAIKADVISDRRVYKLVKVGDDGSVLAATEDDVFQSLIGGPDNGLSPLDPDVSDAVEDDEDKERSDDLASDGGDSSIKVNIIPIQDLAVERQKLKAQIEVLDCILMRVDIEKQRQVSAEKEVAERVQGCHEGNCSTCLININAGEGSGDYKRQRRPNPKYFDYDAGGTDSLMGQLQQLNSASRSEPMPIPVSSRKARRSAVTVVSPRVTSGWGSHRRSGRAAASHRARAAAAAAISQKAPCFMSTTVSKEEVSLDNLSIRELHEAFCSTYGRETFVKDKHWLKRQISAGWMMRQQDHVPVSSQSKHKFKARLDRMTPAAEQPFPTPAAPVDVEDTDRDAANEAHVQGANCDNFRDHAFRNSLCFQRRVTTPAVLSRGGSFGILTTGALNGSGAALGQTAIYGEVVNTGEVVEGKRQRKPNRRYIEDEAHVVASAFVPVHETRPSFYGESECDGLNSTTNYSWRTVETDGSSDMIGRHGTVRGSTLRNVSGKKFSPIQLPKFISIGMKRKVGGRAAKLVKMAHSTARAARQDAEAVIRKAKFRLPATPDVAEPNGMPEMNGESGEQASNGMHVVQFDPSVIGHSRGESEQAIVTVPTANGGTRRKHHRPWTLREVMKLVEGVARCGGGKWADIKKLAFSTVGYRTAVDLKGDWGLIATDYFCKHGLCGHWFHLVTQATSDKWRNLLRASRAQLHLAKQGERKKQFTAAIPAPILARVRELALLPTQFPSGTVSGSSTSRSGRIVHRK